MADDPTQPEDATDWRDKIANVLTDPVGSLVNAVPDPFPRLTSAMQGDFSSLAPNTTLQPQPDETSDQYIARMTGPGSTTQFMHDPATNFAMGMLGSIGGIRSATADLGGLSQAETMVGQEAEGLPLHDYMGRFNPVPLSWQKTGWWDEPGKYGLPDWKYEIKDAGSSVSLPALQELSQRAQQYGNKSGAFMRLGDVYNNPNVFDAYAHVPKMWIRDVPQSWNMPTLNGAYIPKQGSNPEYMVINTQKYLNPTAEPNEALELVHHEVNHAIQDYEDFHTGALAKNYYSPVLKDLLAERADAEKLHGTIPDGAWPTDDRINQMKGEAYQAYRQTYGENEARNFALRSITPGGHDLFPGWTADYLPNELVYPWKTPLFAKPSMGSLADPTGYRLLQP